MTSNDKKIVLIGIRGSGKSTIGKLLAKKLNRTFIDLDEAVREKVGVKTTIEAIRTKGKLWITRYEEKLLKSLLLEQRSLVIATGGRIFSHEFKQIKKRNLRNVQKYGVAVLPLVSKKILWKRIVKDRLKQHAHLDRKTLRENFEESVSYLYIYKHAADIIVRAGTKTPNHVASQIAKKLREGH